jgi:hypothetical protein
MAKFLPTLGVTGWSNDTARTADYLLACFLTTLQADSVLHRGQNTSMQYTLKVKANDPIGIEDDLTQDLKVKFQSVFGASAEVYVDMTVDDQNKPEQYSIKFTGIVHDDEGKALTVGRIVYFDDGKVVKIAQLNNG